jgi:hypothetical protein
MRTSSEFLKKLGGIGSRFDNMNLVDRLDFYQYLWDGSDEWSLFAIYEHSSSLKIRFAGSQATIEEIIAVRKLIVAYQNTPAIEIKSLLKNKQEIDLGIMPSIEARRLISEAKELTLSIVAIDASVTNYLPIHSISNTALIIEDDDLAKRVIEKMLKSGIPIIEHIEID